MYKTLNLRAGEPEQKNHRVCEDTDSLLDMNTELLGQCGTLRNTDIKEDSYFQHHFESIP